MGEPVVVIVQMTGKLEIDSSGDLTADELVERAMEQWGIRRDVVADPFVVTHDQLLNKFRNLEGAERIGPLCDTRDVVRVIMPLKG